MSHVRAPLYDLFVCLCVRVSSTCCWPLCYFFTGLLSAVLCGRKQQFFVFFAGHFSPRLPSREAKKRKKNNALCLIYYQRLMVLSAGSGGPVATGEEFSGWGGVGFWSVPLSFFHLSHTHVVGSDRGNWFEKQRSGIYFEYLFIYVRFLQFSSSWPVFDHLAVRHCALQRVLCCCMGHC